MLDFPNADPPAPEVQEARQALFDKYGAQGFPTLIIADAKGRPISEAGRSLDVADWKDILSAGVDAGKAIKSALATANEKEGVDKAKALIAALEAVPNGVAGDFYPDAVAAIIAADPEDTTGYRAAIEEDKMLGEFEEKLNELAEKEDLDGMLELVDNVIAKLSDTEIKQNIMGMKLQILAQLERKAEALKALDELIALDPNSEMGQYISQNRADIIAELGLAEDEEKKPAGEEAAEEQGE